jgi:hypothetical protein
VLPQAERGAQQPPPEVGGRSLEQLRRDEHAAYDGYKLQLRRDLEQCMVLASDRERARELTEIATRLEGLRRPEAGLSRKQLKVVNGALLAVAEALQGSVASPLQEEAVMMRRVARRHNHGLKACEEANEQRERLYVARLQPYPRLKPDSSHIHDISKSPVSVQK